MLSTKAQKLLRGEMKLYTEEGRQSTKLKRLKVLRQKPHKGLPTSYTQNSEKESLALQYVSDFHKQLVKIQISRKDLFLVAKNEYDVPKFVSTTIHPTELPFKDVYDYQECADFVANFLDYEPLEHATRTPSYLPSSTQVLSWGTGDSFDFAVLLTSYLNGAGYDAYVVYGNAPAWVTLRDQTHMQCPLLQQAASNNHSSGGGSGASGHHSSNYLLKQQQAAAAARPSEGADVEEELVSTKHQDDNRQPYTPKPRLNTESKYLKEVDEMSRRGPQPIDPFAEPEVAPTAEVEEAEKCDPLQGKRVHAWVMIAPGKRDLAEGPLFIEPSTGRCYSSITAPYHSVEAVWNHKNYWVNMTRDTPFASLAFDLSDSETWEYVFIDPFNQPPKLTPEEAGGFEDMESAGRSTVQEARKMELNENILDVPLPWASRLDISKDLFRLKYPPRGGRVTLYHKVKLEVFAESVHSEGLVQRLTLFLDRQRTLVKERRELFKNRIDRLERRVHYPMERKFVETFLPGRPGSLREWTEWVGKRRVLHYNVSARLDGLTCREEDFGVKIIERFESRPDFLMYRSVRLAVDNTGSSKSPYTLQDAGAISDVVVAKMTEKYARNPARRAHDNVAKRTFYVSEGRVRTIYHYDDPRVTRNACVTFKDRGSYVGTANDDVLDMGEEALQQVLTAEKECFTAIRHSQMEMTKLSERRVKEEQHVKLERPIYERTRDRGAEAAKKEEESGRDAVADGRRVDYLTPFLANVKDPNNLTKDEGRHVRDACLKALKERLLERANIIQTRLNEENAALSKIQANFQRSQQSVDENVEEYERYCSEAMFRIEILTQRLISHEDTAVKKYTELDEKLANDPRLTHALR